MHINVSIPNIASGSCSKGIYRRVTFYKKSTVGVTSVTVYRGSLQGRYLARVIRKALSQPRQLGQINE